MLVSALYNIVDQIFIGQGVGMLGNAATNVAFPVTTISTATALLLGIGSASNYNLEMGAGREEKASRIAGTGLGMLTISGTVIAVIILVFLKPLLHVFGGTAEVMPYAVDYVGITAFGCLFCADDRRKPSHQGGQEPYLFHDLYAHRRGHQYHFRPAVYFRVRMGNQGLLWRQS